MLDPELSECIVFDANICVFRCFNEFSTNIAGKTIKSNSPKFKKATEIFTRYENKAVTNTVLEEVPKVIKREAAKLSNNSLVISHVKKKIMDKWERKVKTKLEHINTTVTNEEINQVQQFYDETIKKFDSTTMSRWSTYRSNEKNIHPSFNDCKILAEINKSKNAYSSTSLLSDDANFTFPKFREAIASTYSITVIPLEASD